MINKIDETNKDVKGSYASVNGLNMYYEVSGKGLPLILLHGGVGASEMFDAIQPQLAEKRQVIAVHLQAHGRTADIMGYSLGAGVALQTATRHPDAVRKLVIISAPVKRDRWYPEVLEGMAQMNPETAKAMKQTPLYQLYPNADWAVLFTKLNDLLRKDYDWSKEVAAIRSQKAHSSYPTHCKILSMLSG